MAWDYRDIMLHQEERLKAERQEALGMLEAARVSEDLATVNAASDVILRVDRDYSQLQRYANNYAAQVQRQQQAQANNRHGFSNTEVDVALNSFQDRPDLPRLTRDQKLDLYAANKQRYWQMRNSGQYRDDQGTVRR
jgi:hypothetical protein